MPNTINAKCNHCGSDAITLKGWYPGKGILGCVMCGENEESKDGISIEGKRIGGRKE
jgi:hypothetical protein